MLKRGNTHDFFHFCETREAGGSKVCPELSKPLLFHIPGLEDYKGSNNGL